MKLRRKAMQDTTVELSGAVLQAFRHSEYYELGDERAPFFSEVFLYNLVGKDEARRILREVGYYDVKRRCMPND